MSDDAVISRMIASAEQIQADARQLKRDHDLVGLFRAGYVLTLKQAANARHCSDETIRKACEKTVATDHALGVMFEGRWIIDKTRLLDWIERTAGKPARLAAESRLKKYAPCAQPRELV
jgi:hypothetical protein